VSEVGSVASDAATAASGAASQANSIASAAATAVNGGSTEIPQNLSIGTKQYCVGFSNHVECQQLPLNVSSIVLQGVIKILSDQTDDLEHLRSVLAKATPGWIRDPFIIGIATALVVAAVFFTSMFSWPFGAGSLLQGLTLLLVPRLVLGLFCCICYLLPTIVLYLLYSKSKELSSEFKADQGPVGGYCWGTLLSAMLMTAMTTCVHIFA
jgi:ABC-type multidrug transport system fused ATPase/permease subunit